VSVGAEKTGTASAGDPPEPGQQLDERSTGGSDAPERIVEVHEGETASDGALKARIIASGPGPLDDIEGGSVLKPTEASRRWSIRVEVSNEGDEPVTLRRAFEDRALFDDQGHRRPAVPGRGRVFVINGVRDDSGEAQPDLLLPGATAWAEQSWAVRDDDAGRQLTLNLRLTDETLFRFLLEPTPAP